MTVESKKPVSVTVDNETVEITDQDLCEQLTGSFPSETIKQKMYARIGKMQLERNELLQRRAEMTPIQRRRDEARTSRLEQELDTGDIHHIHSVLALCALPYKRIADDEGVYRRKYGRMSLTVHAGDLADAQTGDMIPQGIPFGPKARLLQLHICTRAIRQKSPEITIEDNLSSFIRSLGFDVTGGSKGTIRAFKEQLNRLAACHMQIGLWDGSGHAQTINTQPIESMDVWFPNDPDQRMLWPSKVVLSEKFYRSLAEHALPIDIRALTAVSHSAKQIDILLWLAYRLKPLKHDYRLDWETLKRQFCQSEHSRLIDFQRDFKKDIRDIGEIFGQDLPVQLTDSGLILKPCNPEKLFVPPKKRLK